MSALKASGLKIVLAFAVVYLVWGSTYLAIRFAVQSFPPFLMAGLRFGIAGLLVLGFSFATRAAKPNWREVLNASIVGWLMLSLGNAAVSWSETRIPSGVTALLVGSVTFWMLLLNWVAGARVRPSVTQVAGLFVGMFGIAVLVLPSGIAALGRGVDVLGALAVVAGSFSWALGTQYARTKKLPGSPWMANGIEMFAAGVALILGSLVSGEYRHTTAISDASVFSLAYLIVFGSIVAYSAYTWLNRVTSPARLSTYAYVNPVVAVLLGAIFAAETITLRSVLAMVLIVGAVVLLSLRHNAGEKKLLRVDSSLGAKNVREGMSDELGSIHAHHLRAETADEAISGECA